MANIKHWSEVSTNLFYYRFQSTFLYPLFTLHSMNASIYAICPNGKRVLFNIFFIRISKCTAEPLNEEKSHLPSQQRCNLLQNHLTMWLSEANVKQKKIKNTHFYSFLYGAAFCSFDWNGNRNGILSMIHCNWDPTRTESYFNWKLFFFTLLLICSWNSCQIQS